MKKLLPFFIAVLFTGKLIAQNQESIPDGKFATWNTYTWMDPNTFQTSNDQIFSNAGTVANVTQVAGNKGAFAVQLATTTLSPGYMLDGNSSGNGFTGGIPYNAKPTGIRFYYKYAPNTNDTAAVLVIFKKSGVPMDSLYIRLYSASSYTSFQRLLSSPLPNNTDTIIFGAISSISAIGGGAGHVGSILTIDSVSFTGVGAGNQPTSAVFNGNFANWTTNNLYVPTGGWYTNLGTTRTTDVPSSANTYALELQTINFQGSAYVGEASTAYYPQNCSSNCSAIGGKAYTVPASNKDTLQFDYKYVPKTGDTGSIQLTFFKDGLAHGTAFYYNATVGQAQSTWVAGTIPFDLTGQFTGGPDSVIITIDPSSHNGLNSNSQYTKYEGTVFEIDNLTFASQNKILSVNNLSSVTTGVKAYPNPTKDVLNLEFTNLSGDAQLSVYDITGRQIKQDVISINSNIYQVNTNGMSPGIYFYKVTTENGSFENKFIKE